MERIIYIAFDQLNVAAGVMQIADKAKDHIVLVESQRMLTSRRWHKQRLLFLLSSARHFTKHLTDSGWDVTYLKSATTIDGLLAMKDKHPGCEVWCATPNSFRLRKSLADFGANFVENNFFLTSTDLFTRWASEQKTFTMENFYRAQRKRLAILMEGSEPAGGSWNYDADNRLPPPKLHDWGLPVDFKFDEIDEQVISELPQDAWGRIDGKTWGTSRAEALTQMSHFFANHFKNFGPYEDSMPAESWSAHHSLISPYLNNGLLLASEVVTAALVRYAQGDIPISSCEGFIRQIIGWREYINGMYWYLGEDYRENNQLKADRKLLPLFHDPAKTQMNCVRSVVTDIEDRGWTHHIPRLMVLSNLALVTGVSPQEFLNWMREVFIDAADWVMVPNVIGMATHADGGVLMTKPYASGGAYISKMGQFCKSCIYDPKKRTGDDACPFTTLYWDFLDRHAETFGANHRMFQQMGGLRRLSNLAEVKERAAQVLHGLENGKI